jgi:signal transduction histidine kinase
VGEFSSFARLPRAELAEGDLRAFLREQEAHFAASASGRPSGDDAAILSRVDLRFDIPDNPMPAAIDREMLHRMLTNIVQNGAQALRDARRGAASARLGTVAVTARREGAFYVIDVDDDGPGIAPEVRDALFDPYITTKRDGTGLGLTIVKKIVVDHGGTIEAMTSPLGGARFEVRLPRAGTPEARAAIERASRADDDEHAPSSPHREVEKSGGSEIQGGERHLKERGSS